MNYDRLSFIAQQEQVQILPIKVGQFLEVQERVGEDKNRRIRKLR